MNHAPAPMIALALASSAGSLEPQGESLEQPRAYSIPLIDLAGEKQRQVVVDREEGQYRVRLMDNEHRWDCAYPGVEILPDGTIVTTTYGHWREGESPCIVSVRLKLEELDAKAAELGG